MGLFSSKETYVASTLYNLAGAAEGRMNYMKTLVVGNTISNTKNSMTDTIVGGYLRGPGMKLRNFFRWSETNYNLIGIPTGKLGGRMAVDYAVVEANIPRGEGEGVSLQLVEVAGADYTYWAEQWMLDNHPTLVDSNWVSDINEATGTITITFADATTTSFPIEGFDKSKPYIYATYNLIGASTGLLPQVGEEITIDPPTDPFPSTSGWTLTHEESAMVDGNTRHVRIYEITIYMGQDPEPGVDRTYSLKNTMTLTEVRDPANVVLSRKHQTTTRKIIHSSWSQAKLFIYQIGSGNEALDQLVQNEVHTGEFVPFIPVRLDNEFLSETYEPDAYAVAKKAFKKATAGDFDTIVEKLEDNEQLEDIDYAYVVHGVALNVKDAKAREYLFRFFDRCRQAQTLTNVEYLLWRNTTVEVEERWQNWQQWKEVQENDIEDDPLYGEPEPVRPVQPMRPTNYVRISAEGDIDTNLDMEIGWTMIELTEGAGLKKPDAKVGDYWLTIEPNMPDSPKRIYTQNKFISSERIDNTTFAIHWQVDVDSWKTLTVSGAYHQNRIYDNKSVLITSTQALEDSEESGFLVPLHFDTIREMGLIGTTQMATACSFLVLNSYKVVKKEWYETGFFKIIVLVVIIAISIAFPPLGGAALATWAAVGAAIGLTGLLAVVVGAVIVSLVSMLVMRLIGEASVAIFGEKFGAIIGAVVSFVAVAVGQGLLSGANISAIWGSMMSAQSLLSLTNATVNGISGYVQASARGVVMQTQDLLEDYAKESKELSEKFAQNIGYDRGMIDPLSLTDSPVGNYLETEAQFLTRTLLTGSDIAELSLDMLTNFADYTLTTNLPLS